MFLKFVGIPDPPLVLPFQGPPYFDLVFSNPDEDPPKFVDMICPAFRLMESHTASYSLPSMT